MDSSLASVDNVDFVHKVGTRPPQLIFTRLPVRSLVLQPGHLRSTLTGYIVESLSVECRHSDTDSSLRACTP